MNVISRSAPIITALAAALVCTPTAWGHVTLNPGEWEAGGFARFAVRVPNERDDAATTKVTIRFPQQVLSASFQPVEGWNRKVTMATLDEPIDDEGEQITERIDTVTWSGGRIRPGEFQEFGVSFQVPEEPPGTELAFPALQTYSDGEIVRWIGPADAEQPAPVVAVTQPAADGEAAASPAATPTPDGGGARPAADEGSDSDTLSIIALVAGLAGLAAGLLALFSRSRRRDTAGDPGAHAPIG